MKANELMVGDWVYDTILKCNTKVEFLCKGGIRGDIHERVWGEETFAPIPITPEILEKNGFKLSPCSRNNYNEITIEVLYGKYERCENDGILRIPKDWKIILFVHRFQHALRLCGIDKEIKL